MDVPPKSSWHWTYTQSLLSKRLNSYQPSAFSPWPVQCRRCVHSFRVHCGPGRGNHLQAGVGHGAQDSSRSPLKLKTCLLAQIEDRFGEKGRCGQEATADPSTHHPQTEKRLGPCSLRMTDPLLIRHLYMPSFAQDDNSLINQAQPSHSIPCHRE